MSRRSREELETLRDDGLSADRRRDFLAAHRAVAAWERAHPQGLDGILSFVEGLRVLFGDPPVNREPWRGDDFRL
ncbi:MAG: hypothetical protein IT386_04790 [Deltaproteobacteria bacterium]|nr:hypothetical protein [Deltaproteobacteria bacterium]